MSSEVAPAEHRGQPSDQDSGGTAGQDDLARRMADLARDLQQQASPQETLDRVVAAATAMVPGAEGGTITIVRGHRRVETAAATGDVPRALDRVQEETGQGPCLDALYEQATVRVDDLATEHRWPALAARAGEIGAASVLCFQLFVSGDNLGSLDLVAGEPGAFDDESEHVGLLFAAHAAVAVADAQELQGVRSALASRDLIGQAKGILMERHRIDADRAFAVLVQASQDANRKLHDVAADLTRTGALRG